VAKVIENGGGMKNASLRFVKVIKEATSCSITMGLQESFPLLSI
jgi:hypothetical protein